MSRCVITIYCHFFFTCKSSRKPEKWRVDFIHAMHGTIVLPVLWVVEMHLFIYPKSEENTVRCRRCKPRFVKAWVIRMKDCSVNRVLRSEMAWVARLLAARWPVFLYYTSCVIYGIWFSVIEAVRRGKVRLRGPKDFSAISMRKCHSWTPESTQSSPGSRVTSQLSHWHNTRNTLNVEALEFMGFYCSCFVWIPLANSRSQKCVAFYSPYYVNAFFVLIWVFCHAMSQ